MVRSVQLVIALSLLATVSSALVIYPHQLCYFNEFSGGPRNGHRHLVHSNLDWGQDLLFLREWSEANPNARPLHIYSLAVYVPDHLGIQTLPLRQEENRADAPWWCAVGVTELQRCGVLCPVRWDAEPAFESCAKLPSHSELIGRSGYSICIFRVD
jgi:hypothetical protein